MQQAPPPSTLTCEQEPSEQTDPVLVLGGARFRKSGMVPRPTGTQPTTPVLLGVCSRVHPVAMVTPQGSLKRAPERLGHVSVM